MNAYDLAHFPGPEPLAEAAAADWIKKITAPSATAGARYLAAVSGGRIAVRFFAALARLANAGGRPLSAVHFFWADERCVPPSDEESNYGLAQKHLFGPLSFPADQVHRVRGEDAPAQAAAEAGADLHRMATEAPNGQPVLDLIFLGMGEDGHVASLFPSEPESATSNPAVYRPVVGPKPPPQRVTLGYPAIVAAREVWVLVSGAGKAIALRNSLSGDASTPLARVLKLRKQTRILTDIAL